MSQKSEEINIDKKGTTTTKKEKKSSKVKKNKKEKKKKKEKKVKEKKKKKGKKRENFIALNLKNKYRERFRGNLRFLRKHRKGYRR